MRGFSDFLTNELIIARMARALRKVDDLGTTARLIAYAKASIPSEQIRDFDSRAWEVEHIRRTRVEKRAEYASRAASVGLYALAAAPWMALFFMFAPERAFAGEVQPMPMGIDWITTISIALFFLWLVYLCLPAVRNTVRAVEQDNDDRPHGDTTGWRE